MSILTRRSVISSLASVMAVQLAMPHIARAALRTVRFGHNTTDESPYGQGSRAFAEAVAADPVIGSALKIEVHGMAELGDELGMLNNCVKGLLDGMLCTNGVVGNIVPEFGILNAPYLFRDVAWARAKLDGPIGAEFSALAHAKDINVLAWGENGLRHITADRPIRTLSDLSGLKIRTPQSEVMVGGLRALGANPGPLSYGLLREALRTGQFQATDSPITVIEASKLYELQRYVSLTGQVYDPAMFLCSSDLLEDLTEPQRAALAKCAMTGGAATRRASDVIQEKGVAHLRSVGMTVIDDVDLTGFKVASRPFLQELGAKYDAGLVKRVVDAGA